jgi:hypothetical protein
VGKGHAHGRVIRRTSALFVTELSPKGNSSTESG